MKNSRDFFPLLLTVLLIILGQDNFFASTYWFISLGTMITYCPPLTSYDENKSGLQHRLSTSYGGRLVEGRLLLPSSPMHFGQLYHRSINREKLCFHLTNRAAPGSILTLPQTRYCPIYGNSSPVTISFYYYWLLNKSCVRQEGKTF